MKAQWEATSADGDGTIADRVARRRRKRSNSSTSQSCRQNFEKKKKKNSANVKLLANLALKGTNAALSSIQT